MSDPTLYRIPSVPHCGTDMVAGEPVPVVAVLVVCPTCDGEKQTRPPMKWGWIPCPDCTPLDDGDPSGVVITYKDQP